MGSIPSLPPILMNKKLSKNCYVCLKELGFSKIIYYPQNNQERYVCLNKEGDPIICTKVLQELTDDGSCMRNCCRTYKMASFDIEESIQKVKNERFIPQYNQKMF